MWTRPKCRHTKLLVKNLAQRSSPKLRTKKRNNVGYYIIIASNCTPYNILLRFVKSYCAKFETNSSQHSFGSEITET